MHEIFYLKKEVQIIENLHGELTVRYGTEAIFSIYKNKSLFKKLFLKLEVGTSIINIRNQFELDELKIVENFLIFFQNNKLISSNQTNSFYDRQVKYFSILNSKSDIDEHAIQKSIIDASILIVGLGGIGTHISFCLASTGFGTIGLCDDDYIEESNLNRCIGYSRNDIGKYKSKILRKYLSKIYQGTTFKSYTLPLQKINAKSLTAYDFVIIAIDKTKNIEQLITQKLSKLAIPYIFSNYGEQFGMISKVNHLSKNTVNTNQTKIINSYVAPSVYWNSMIIAGITAKEVIAYLTNGLKSISKDEYILLDLNQLTLKISKSP